MRLSASSRMLCLLLAILGAGAIAAAEDDDGVLSAGTFTAARTDAKAYSQPSGALSERQSAGFLRGEAGFNRPWVVFGISTGDWGLGPTFVSNRCAGCHAKGGRGEPPDDGQEQLASMVVRLSVSGTDPNGGPKPHERYGDQFQNRALQGQTPEFLHAYAPVPAEAELYLDWDEHTESLADGTEVALRKPKVRIERLAFGELGPGVMLSLRNAPPVFGLGLLEAVPKETLLDLAARQRALGYAGRPNYVWDVADQRRVIGRFGWKAGQPSLRQQVAAAAINDIGATSNLFPRQNCPDIQAVCRAEVPGNDPELTDSAWDDLELHALGVAVPARRQWGDAPVQRGAKLFDQLQCAVCHVPVLRTGEYHPRLPQLARQVIHPYTDLLLHDMGEGLADGRPEFAAGGRDWRTPPLWGLGLSKRVNGSTALLHDGRARNVTEAILWHGGEAQASRDAFARLTRADREALLAFLDAI